MKVTIIPIMIGAFGMETKGERGSWRMSGKHQNYSIIENGQNTEKSPRDLRILAVTKNPVKNQQLKLMWKTLMNKIIKPIFNWESSILFIQKQE